MKKITKILVFALVAVMLFGAVGASAFEPYETYTYSIDGKAMKSPPAYRAEDVLDALDMNLGAITPDTPNFNSASDLVVDEQGDIYIADKGNNRIVILDKYYQAKAVISSYVDENGKTQTFNAPQGLYVTDPNITTTGESYIYVCDTGNFRIVIFDRDYNYVRTVVKPESEILSADAFKPMSIAVDLYGKMFITSTSCYEGVIVLSSEGDFTGFSGAQDVSVSLIKRIWSKFQTKEQRETAIKTLAVPYNNITVDKDGFIYVTTNTTDMDKMTDQWKALTSKSSTNSPVKKLNAAGDEVMKRNGFFDPGGEVNVMSNEVSQIIDVSIGAEGSWSILDQKRSRIFTYDSNGNLLFAFGDIGDQLGNGEKFVAMTYHVVDGKHYMILLDNSTSGYRLTVYSPTKYCDTIMSALATANNNNYSESITYWQDVLTQNNNFDLAYIGIGKALFNQGKYEEAQNMLENAYETDVHGKAFSQIRKEFIQKYLLLIVIGVIVLLVAFFKFLGYAKKKNKVTTLKVGRKTYWEELIYAFHLMFHPFDGFWDLKHEQRGSLRASFTIIGITILAFFYQAIGRGYSFNPRGDFSTVFLQLIAVIVPVILWCVGNWCLTSLFDGEGSFKDIIVATGYALSPLPGFIILSTILTNVMTSSEGTMVTLLVTIGYVWAGILLFFGMLVTHDYSLNKNFVVTLGTIVAMGIIMFVMILFSSLVAKMISFVVALFSEIGNRI